MSDTKENILMTSLRLFARDGYEAVSVSTIAGELGMTKGALYKHYKNKRDIFDCIVERMVQVDAEHSQKYRIPEQKYEDAPTAYENVSWESIRDFTIAQFSFWTKDDFACSFRKMLALEQYRNAEMGELYCNCIVAGPIAYMEDIFRTMAENGRLRKANPKQLALEYYAPLFLLINLSDSAKNEAHYMALLSDHINRFIERNAINSEKLSEPAKPNEEKPC